MLMVVLVGLVCLKVPALHEEQTVLPRTDNQPREQLEHATAAAELYLAASHTTHMSLKFAPMVGLAFPAGHELQVASEVAPRAVLYFPASHFSQLSSDDWPSETP